MVAYRFRCRAASATTFHALTQLLDTLSRGTADLSSPDRSRSDGPNLYPPTLLSILPSTHPSTHLSTHVYGGPTMCQEGRKQLSLRHSPQLKSLSPPLSLSLSLVHTHAHRYLGSLTLGPLALLQVSAITSATSTSPRKGQASGKKALG